MKLTNDVKAIVLDLDGTLLNSQKEVSERSKRAILTAHERGLAIIFATARPPRSVNDFLCRELQEIASVVYYNGALSVDNQLGRKHYPIEQMLTEEILNYIHTNQPDAYISIESEDIWYSSQNLDYKQVMKVTTNPTVVTIDELRKIQASKILISQCYDYKSLQELFEGKVNIIRTDSGSLIQIMDKDVSKERAVIDICTAKRISMDYVMSFGDDWNDFNLFRESGLPVAMGNAIPELKEIAFFVTGNNDEEGVAQVLEQITFGTNPIKN
ncbi:HAD family hydrolase [Bacillus pseudomycoides]|uniref:Hydrolase n=1 Tax=Bacillus pseudomycoides TaxID=64104 RepID=A0A2B4MDL8_9BACI|nr:HAD family hydrolase [Bacillus pseudomycoides]PDY46808.1 hydrolase [Bacillus pseudomycoides]PEA80371.1 hydrolase [Bacillus pseudomycoides]PED07408.1 hydrolase [Bacillus pseudomycoides]PED73546.1 hydrolase [Bacillus pseudomycoides]PEI46778.1 hydrolase [Bacillus pseudomycoides]